MYTRKLNVKALTNLLTMNRQSLRFESPPNSRSRSEMIQIRSATSIIPSGQLTPLL